MFRFLSGVLLFWCCFTFTQFARAEELSLMPQNAVLVLRNQQVIAGKVTRLGDSYHLSLGDSGDIRIPKGDVQYIAANLEEVYANKVAALPRRSCDAHLALADWCIRQKMFSQAAEQMVKAMAIRPQDPRLAQLEARLQAATQPVAETKVVLQEKLTATVGRDQLERTVQELPTGAMEKFTVVIQPLVIDRCGASGCHGSSSESSFQLVQPTQTRVPSRRFTQRNLFATLSLVDRENPSESRLLKIAREAHGGRKEAIFARDEDRQYQELKDWILSVGQNRFAKLDRPQTVNTQQLAGPQRQVGQAEEPGEAPPVDEVKPLPPVHTEVRDPFDPAPYNERFFQR